MSGMCEGPRWMEMEFNRSVEEMEKGAWEVGTIW